MKFKWPFRGWSWRKILVRLVLVDSLFSLASYAFYRYATEPEESGYITAPVREGRLEQAVIASGVLQGSRQLDVGAQVSGQVKQVLVAPNDQVRQGQLLAEIDPLPARNALRQAQVQVQLLGAQADAARFKLERAEQAQRRYQRLIQHGAVSAQEAEQARAAYAQAKGDYASQMEQSRKARVQRDTAQVNLDYTRILAPADGTVLAIVTQPGQTVIAEQAPPVLLKMADLSRMTIKAQVAEADVLRIHPGLPVYFTLMGDPDTRYEATLREIEPAPQYLTGQGSNAGSGKEAVFYTAVFDVPNPQGRLRVSMSADVRIVLGVAENALSIPLAALGAKDAQGRFEVRVLEEGDKVRTTQVETGLRNQSQVQVRSGLKAGERVVLAERDKGTL
ncbi:efflux RND transporter periplasmic adaptor subunit [Pseudomonas sp. DTU_2021_1001937_2_SI_NGA_ILE_001]|uniref:efflux RND transporter periplasmic adaptor subunit n=1 Tax=Pseudomonas sp. DTU_2021_1001937_2_SI_NGA_ILE_001 TaxID=3077589 RepID=UPI0028FC1FA5|nr:efflux RND transporter periplasmic adaptor subunit [Pseudomonas sp. DTU_2021_1001937_2_SI_NGA_ILE_001]WNW10370.1 efflux RND transporter periplasmic adaptor subunit [Pseudomonas sp. DTU_2021_1001937_2_SI_NGA_ILE_001]